MIFALALAASAAAQDDASPAFRYAPGDVIVAVEQRLQREVDPRLGYARTVGNTTERRYTVLGVDADGIADVLVEETCSPQNLHEYSLRGVDARAGHLAKGFDPAETAGRRVLRTTMTPRRFRTESARTEPAVYYLQEIPELLSHVLALPADGEQRLRVVPELPRLRAAIELSRDGNAFAGTIELAIRDPRLRDGAEVECPQGELRFEFDPSSGLPRNWRVVLRYPRHPVNRPNELVVTGELFAAAPLDEGALAVLRADVDAHAAVEAAFFAGHFPRAIAAAEQFLESRPESQLAAAVRDALAAFRAQVPHFGQAPPELAVAHHFGEAPASLAELQGNVVLLDFWAVWCTPCVAGFEHKIEAVRQLGSAGLRVLGITRVDRRQSVDDVQRFHETGYAAAHDGLQLNFPLVVAGDERLHDFFEVRAIPKLVVLDRAGKVYWEQTGTGGEARLDRMLRALLDG